MCVSSVLDKQRTTYDQPGKVQDKPEKEIGVDIERSCGSRSGDSDSAQYSLRKKRKSKGQRLNRPTH